MNMNKRLALTGLLFGVIMSGCATVNPGYYVKEGDQPKDEDAATLYIFNSKESDETYAGGSLLLAATNSGPDLLSGIFVDSTHIASIKQGEYINYNVLPGTYEIEFEWSTSKLAIKPEPKTPMLGEDKNVYTITVGKGERYYIEGTVSHSAILNSTSIKSKVLTASEGKERLRTYAKSKYEKNIMD